jgi:hypothetical protein
LDVPWQIVSKFVRWSKFSIALIRGPEGHWNLGPRANSMNATLPPAFRRRSYSLVYRAAHRYAQHCIERGAFVSVWIRRKLIKNANHEIFNSPRQFDKSQIWNSGFDS